jgi:hypothetical protein
VNAPSQLRLTDKMTLTWNQLRDVLAKTGLRDRILVQIDTLSRLIQKAELQLRECIALLCALRNQKAARA